MQSLLFSLAFATYAAHTLDSMTQADWRLVLPTWPEEDALFVYVVAHIPLVGLAVWLTGHDSPRMRGWSRLIFCTFLVLHVGIHRALEGRPHNTFDSHLSLALIYGSGLLGLLYLIAAGIARVLQSKYVDSRWARIL